MSCAVFYFGEFPPLLICSFLLNSNGSIKFGHNVKTPGHVPSSMKLIQPLQAMVKAKAKVGFIV